MHTSHISPQNSNKWLHKLQHITKITKTKNTLAPNQQCHFLFNIPKNKKYIGLVFGKHSFIYFFVFSIVPIPSIIDWIAEWGYPTAFEMRPEKEIASLLKSFYAEVRTKKGRMYQHQTMISLRASLNRYFVSPPFNCTLTLSMTGHFKQQNKCSVAASRP